MRALILKHFGGMDALELADWPAPAPREREVEIEVHAASINPVEFKFRKKAMWPLIVVRPPLVMGQDCAGIVRRVGPGTTRFKEGDRVFTRVGKATLGAFAESVCVHEDFVGHKPASLSMNEATAVALVGLTALQAMFEDAQLKSGQRIFIQAGAGGFGTIAIQLAARAGAHVATTASGVGLDLVKRLGATDVVDYKNERWQDRLKDFDVVIDTLGGSAALDAFGVVKPGGIVVSIGGDPTVENARKEGVPLIWHPAFWFVSRKCLAAGRRRGARYAFSFVRPDGLQLEQLASRFERKELEVVIDKVFPFEQAKEAIAYVEAGRSKGKVVLEMRTGG